MCALYMSCLNLDQYRELATNSRITIRPPTDFINLVQPGSKLTVVTENLPDISTIVKSKKDGMLFLEIGTSRKRKFEEIDFFNL